MAHCPLRSGFWLVAGLVLVLVTGCATYSSRLISLRADLAGGEYETALQTIEDSRKGKDLLLYHLERGLVLHYADEWAQSNEAFQAAEELAADLYTKSISEGVFSLLTSDNTISYRAEAFELAMIPYYRALNYIYLQEKQEALVEARKASLLLRPYADDASAETELADDEEVLARLQNIAFLQYFSGMIYEWGGEVNDAFIAYRQAAASYRTATAELNVQTPPWLGKDLLRTGRQLGFREELDQLRRTQPELFPAEAEAPVPAEKTPQGEVVVLLEIGHVAYKVQNEINVPILESDDYDDHQIWARDLRGRLRPGWRAGKQKIAYWLRIAMPELITEPLPITGARVSASILGGKSVTILAEDLNGRSAATFARKSDQILLKTLLRGLTKYVSQEGAEKQGKVAGLLMNIFGAASETADTRSWLTLPGGIALARLQLPPGNHDLQIDLIGPTGMTLSSEVIAGVPVRAGDWRFLSRRVF